MGNLEALLGKITLLKYLADNTSHFDGNQPEYNLLIIREQLVKYFNSSELRELCFQLNVDYEIINGENKIDKSRELLTYLQRRNRLVELVEYCNKRRPNVKWNVIKTKKEMSNEFMQEIGASSPIANKIIEEKFELYRSTWQALYTLQEAGNALWQRPSKENINNFVHHLYYAGHLVGKNKISFNQADYINLELTLTKFQDYLIGKTILVGEIERIPENTEKIIKSNSYLKKEYEAILETISTNFRTQLNAWTG